MELKQQILQKGFQVPSFCGPDADKHANLDCISVSQPDMQDFQNSGKGAMQQVITSSYTLQRAPINVYLPQEKKTKKTECVQKKKKRQDTFYSLKSRSALRTVLNV